MKVSGGHNRIMALEHEEQPRCSCYLTSAANSMDPPRSLAKRENSWQASFSPPWGRRKLSWGKKGLEFSCKILTASKFGEQISELRRRFYDSLDVSTIAINSYRFKKKKSAAFRIYKSHHIERIFQFCTVHTLFQ